MNELVFLKPYKLLYIYREREREERERERERVELIYS